MALLLAIAALAWFADALRVPFINDDFVVIDAVRGLPFAALWRPHPEWIGGWWRPWSRELHTWTLLHLFGPSPVAFHVVNLALWLAALLLFHRLARRIAPAAAAIATAGVAALAAWGVPVLWAAGAQELWMLVFALAAIDAALARQPWAAALWLSLALLSKETAVVVPAIAWLGVRLLARTPWRAAWRAAAPMGLVVLVWALFHPLIGGRWLHGGAPAAIAPATAPGVVVARSVLATLNLDRVPAPEYGWPQPLARALPGALALAALAWLGAHPRARVPVRVAAFGLAWAAIAWAPLLAPGLGWHAYYGLLGAAGAWLAIATLLAGRPALAALAVAALGLLRGGRAATVSRDWGDEWYLRRAASFMTFLRTDLQLRVPRPAHGARMYFTGVPSNVGFLVGNGPALRLWYADTTLRGGLYADYAPRPGAAVDYFFRYDSTAGWVEISGPDREPAEARARDPHWQDDAEALAVTLSRASDWPAAARTYAELGAAWPNDPRYPYYEGLAHALAGDSTAALAALERAARLPGSDQEMREQAAALRAVLRVSPAGALPPRH